MAKIIVEADIMGNVTVEVDGVKGKSCKDMTKELEAALGVAVKTTEKKEYYEKPLKVGQKVRQS